MVAFFLCSGKPVICDNCGTQAPDSARFCRRCGHVLGADGTHVDLELPGPETPADSSGSPLKAMFLGAAVATAALVVAGAIWISHDKEAAAAERARLLAEARQQAEARLQADVRAARKRAEEAEQALIDAEQQVAMVNKQQDAARRMAEAAAKAEAKAKAERSMKEAQAKKQAAERAMQEAQDKRRAEELAFAATPARPAAPPPPAPAPPPVKVAQVQLSPEGLCRPLTNFIMRGICETRECIKPEYIGSDYCRAIRARGASATPN